MHPDQKTFIHWPDPKPGADLRDAFFEQFAAVFRADKKVVLLSDDQGALALDRLRAEFPERCLNCGIAEQNIVNVAAGLSLSGCKAFVYGITNFISLRCFEQLFLSAGCMSLPMVIVGSGGGLTYSADGPTHHATIDLAVLRAIPGIAVLNPCDAVSTALTLRHAYLSSRPVYLRIEKGSVPDLYCNVNLDYGQGFAVIRPGNQVVVLSSGLIVHEAMKAADALSRAGISTAVVDIFSFKPLNLEALAVVLKDFSYAAVVEEQSAIGGVQTVLAEVALLAGLRLKCKRFGLPDEPCYNYGTRAYLHRQYRIDAAAIEREIGEWIHDSR